MNSPEEITSRPSDHEVFRRDGFRCVYCGHDGRTFETWAFLEVDHFKPRSRGGNDEIGNLVTSCVICNRMKSAFSWDTLDEAKAEIGKWREQMRNHWRQLCRTTRQQPVRQRELSQRRSFPSLVQAERFTGGPDAPSPRAG